jgi:hypothetical protein
VDLSEKNDAFFNKNQQVRAVFGEVVRQKVVNGLILVLNHVSEVEIEVDLQEVFKRFTFDNSRLMVLGFDPTSLFVDFPKRMHAKAFDEIEEATLYRHILPKWCWKLQRWLQLRQEKKLRKAWETFDGFLYHCISSKQEELSRCNRTQLEEEGEFDLLTAYIMQAEKGDMGGGFGEANKFLRDIVMTRMAAGSNTMDKLINRKRCNLTI